MKKTLEVLVVGLACTVSPFAAHAADESSSGAPRLEKVVVRADANFDFDKSSVRPEDAARMLGELGKAGKVTWQSVNATGYTDSVGTREYNQALSVRRANAVKTLLVDKGVEGDMIATAGKAERDPVASNETAEGRAQNRRTAIEFEGVRIVEP